MPSLVKSERIILKDHPEINEAAIQQFIYDDPSVLGLGDLIAIQKEKIQPSGGRLDMLLSDADGEERYEVELQLGATDPSHIIRTIEYWDTERKRYPKYDHCAVIIAEEITGRFMNVISLFNGAIPLIAIQMSAIKHGDNIELIFTKVLDRITLADEDDEAAETTDRNYWEKRSTPKMLKLVDKIFEELGDLTQGYVLKYNKFYIGAAKDGVAKNFISFKPKKSFLRLEIKGTEDPEKIQSIEDAGIDVTYRARNKEYNLRLETIEDFRQHEGLIRGLVAESKEEYGAE